MILNSDMIQTERHCDVVEELMQYPFNVSQVGFSMLVRCIEKTIGYCCSTRIVCRHNI